MHPKTKELRTAVKRFLVPHIELKGFQIDTRQLYERGSNSRLFQEYTRKAGDNLQLLEIQYEKYGHPKFVLNLGSVPPEGTMYYGYHYPQEKTGVSHLPVWARLCERHPWGLRWFGFPLIKIPWFRNPSAEDIVQSAISAFPQVEAWLNDGTKGPNVGVVKINRSAKPPSSKNN